MTLESQDPGLLLADNLTFVRSLARALVRDPDTADDLAQETFVVALQTSGRR